MAASTWVCLVHGTEPVGTVREKLRPGVEQEHRALQDMARWLNGANGGVRSMSFYVSVGSAAFVAAQGTVSATGNPTNGQSMYLGAYELEAATSASTENQFTIGADAGETCVNLAAVINAHSVLGGLFTAVATDGGATGSVLVTAKMPGAWANQVRFADVDLANMTVNGSGLFGGTTAGAGGVDSGALYYPLNQG